MLRFILPIQRTVGSHSTQTIGVRVGLGVWMAFVGTVLLMPSAVTRAQEQVQEQAATTKLGDQYIPLDGIAVAELNPAKLMSSDATVLYPLEIAEAWALDNIGFSPKDCDSIRVISASPGPSGPMAGVVISLNKPFAIKDLNPQLIQIDSPTEVDRLPCFPINGPPGVVIHQPDPKTIVVASTNYLETVVDAAAGGQTGQLAKLASAVDHTGQFAMILAIEPVRPMINGMLQAFANQLPPQLAQFADLPNLLDALLIRVDLEDGDHGAQLIFLAVDDAAAEKIAVMLNDAIQMGRQIAMAQVMQSVREEGPVPDATRAYAERIADRVEAIMTPERDGRRLMLSASPSQGFASQAMLLGMLAPAMQGARFAARGAQAKNDLKSIGLAMHNYHSAYRKLPDPIQRDADGKALLSWRVAILPFIEQQGLYQQFHLDEPWDSEHNIQLLDQMPDIYRHVSIDTAPGKTVYQLPVGEGMMFDTEEKNRFRDILDGLSNTIMVVQSGPDAAVEWTKPQDLEAPLRAIGFVNGNSDVLLGDGSVQVLSQETTEERWNAMLSRAGKD